MQVTTRMLPATNTRGTRIKATVLGACVPATATVAYDYALSARENHMCAAVKALMSLPDQGAVRGKWAAVAGLERGFIFVKLAAVTPCFEVA